ncbi:MAG: hypothetical protein ABIN48_11750, partial [Ginsengibacter sp.]
NFYVSTLETFCHTKVQKAVQLFKSKTIKSKEANEEINAVLEQLDYLIYISPTTERFSLKGSANMRKVLILNTLKQKTSVLSEAAIDYRHAYEIADEVCKIRPLIHWYLLESILVLVSDRGWGKEVGTGAKKYTLPSLKAAKALLSDTKTFIESNQQYAYSYQDKMISIDVHLCELLMEPKNAKQDFSDALLQKHLDAWRQMKSIARKKEGLEVLEIIINILSFSTDKAVKKMHSGLVEVYEVLNKMLKK